MSHLARPVVIRDDAFTLREIEPAQAAQWLELMSLPPIAEFLPDRFDSLDEITGVLNWLVGNYDMPVAEIVRITLGIHPTGGGEAPRGFVTFGPLPEDESLREIGYAVHPDWQRRGIATRAAQLMIGWVRKSITTEPLYATVDPANGASRRVLEKVGFREPGEPDSNRTVGRAPAPLRNPGERVNLILRLP